MRSLAGIPALAAWILIGHLAGGCFDIRPLVAQSAVDAEPRHDPSDLAALVARARAENPRIAAAERAVEAARARARAAGILPDPTLGIGLVNALVGDPFSSDDFMTMRMVQIGQRVPYPGKLGLEERAAAWELSAALADRRGVEREVVAEVQATYAEVVFLDHAREIVDWNLALLDDFASVTEVRYGVGTGSQQDVLKAQVERTRLGDELIGIRERRAGTVADLNGLLDRPSASPVTDPELPERIVAAAIPEPGEAVRFTAAALESTTDPAGPLPDLETLQRLAETESPMIQAHVARIQAQAARAELASRAALPDLDVSVGYGQRSGREDMVTFMLSVPVPIFKSRKQDALTSAELSDLARLEEEHRRMVNEIHAEVASLHAALLRTRGQLALLRDGILPQAQASLKSATAGYPVATVDFLAVLDSQATLFRHELDYHRLLTEFATDLAALERAVGAEVLR